MGCYKRVVLITVDPRVAPDAVRAFLDSVRPAIDAKIALCIDPRTDSPDDSHHDPGRLREAMRYAALGPGKRLRPALTVAACIAVGGDIDRALPAAAAVEMLHAYTLVHDDLPAMDDDDERRGRPTVHVAFGEAIAILAGDGLLTAAFGALAELGPHAADAVDVLARRSGAHQLIAGQAMDLALATSDASADFDTLAEVHWRKTGALFSAAAELGGIAAGATRDERGALAQYGMDIGVAFQYADDRDDREHTQHAERARARMNTLIDSASAIAGGFGARAHVLQAIASWFGRVA